MLNGGFGESHVNNFLSALNIPSICQKSLKEREREVGKKMIEIADSSCKKSLEEEVSL